MASESLSENEQGLIKVCDAIIPSWFNDAITGNDNKEFLDKMDELNRKRDECIKNISNMKKCNQEFLFSVKKELNKQKAKPTGLTCASSKASGLSKGMML